MTTKAQAIAFVDTILGWEALGVDRNGDDVSRPKAPEARAHLEAVLGDKCPRYGHDATNGRDLALAAYLRSVADAIDHPTA